MMFEDDEFGAKPQFPMELFNAKTNKTPRQNVVSWAKKAAEEYQIKVKKSHGLHSKRGADEIDDRDAVPEELRSPDQIAMAAVGRDFSYLCRRGYDDRAVYGTDSMTSVDLSGDHHPGFGMTIEHMAHVAISPDFDAMMPLQETNPNGPMTYAVWSTLQMNPATAFPKGDFTQSVAVRANITVIHASLQLFGVVAVLPTEFMAQPYGMMLWANVVVHLGICMANSDRLCGLVCIGAAYNRTPDSPLNADCQMTYDEYYDMKAAEHAAFQAPDPASITVAFGNLVQRIQSRTNVVYNPDSYTFVMDTAALNLISRARVDLGQLTNVMDIYGLMNDTGRLISIFNHKVYVAPIFPLHDGNVIHVMQHETQWGEYLHVLAPLHATSTYSTDSLRRSVITRSGFTEVTPYHMNRICLTWDFSSSNQEVASALPAWPWAHGTQTSARLDIKDLFKPFDDWPVDEDTMRDSFREYVAAVARAVSDDNGAINATLAAINDAGQTEGNGTFIEKCLAHIQAQIAEEVYNKIGMIMNQQLSKGTIEAMLTKDIPLPFSFLLLNPFVRAVGTDLAIVGHGAIKRVVHPGIATMTNSNGFTYIGAERRQGAVPQFPERIALHTNVAILRRGCGDDSEGIAKLSHEQFDPNNGVFHGAMICVAVPLWWKPPVNLNIINNVGLTGLNLQPSSGAEDVRTANAHPCAGIIDMMFHIKDKILMHTQSVANSGQLQGRASLPPNTCCRERAYRILNPDKTHSGTWLHVDRGNGFWPTYASYDGCQNHRYGGIFRK